MTEERIRVETINVHLKNHHPGVHIVRVEYVYKQDEPVVNHCPICGDEVQPEVSNIGGFWDN